MSASLKDQLCALGIAPKQAGPKRKKPDPAAVSGEMSLDQAYRMRNRQERLQKEQATASKRALERRRREINQKIQALVKASAVRDEVADKKRNFLYKGRIRNVLATAAQIREINAGQLGVVYLSGNYHIMPCAKVAEVRQFAPDHVPDLQGAETAGEEEHPVPDDLTW